MGTSKSAVFIQRDWEEVRILRTSKTSRCLCSQCDCGRRGGTSTITSSLGCVMTAQAQPPTHRRETWGGRKEAAFETETEERERDLGRLQQSKERIINMRIWRRNRLSKDIWQVQIYQGAQSPPLAPAVPQHAPVSQAAVPETPCAVSSHQWEQRPPRPLLPHSSWEARALSPTGELNP